MALLPPTFLVIACNGVNLKEFRLKFAAIKRFVSISKVFRFESFRVSVTVDSAIEYADESGGRAYARKAHCANLFEWLARLMVSCTQFPGNLIPSEIDLILTRIKVDRGWNQNLMHVRSRDCGKVVKLRFPLF